MYNAGGPINAGAVGVRETKQGDVTAAIDRLQTAVATCEDRTKGIISRLDPVLNHNPRPTNDSSPMAPVPTGCCGLSAEIHRLAGQLEASNNALADASQRCEL